MEKEKIDEEEENGPERNGARDCAGARRSCMQ
jgi:hypothetical protein